MPEFRPIEDLRDGDIDQAIAEAEAEFERDGKLHDARQALARLRQKHLDTLSS